MPSTSNKSKIVLPANTSPTGTCCITVPLPDDLEYKTLFLGHLHKLTQQVWYERDSAHSAVAVAAIWQQVYDCVSEQINMVDCCGGGTGDLTQIQILNQINRGIVLNWQQQYIDASNDITAVFIYAPDTYYNLDSGDSGAEIVQRDEALCFAVTELVNAICNAGLQQLESYAVEGVAGLIALAATGLLGVIVAMAGLGLAVEWAILMQRDDYREWIACCIYNSLRDEDIQDETAFTDSFSGCDDPPDLPPEVSIIRGSVDNWIRSQLNHENWLVFVDYLATAYNVVQMGAAPPCACLGEWEYEMLGGNGQGILTLEDNGGGYTPSYQGAPQDRVLGVCHGTPNGAIWSGMSFTGLYGTFNLREIYIEFDAGSHRAGSSDSMSWRKGALQGVDAVEIASNNNVAGDGQSYEVTTLNENMDALYLYWDFAISNTTCPQSGMYVRTTYIRLRGVGRNPFV